jgi:hypothetical protein
MITLATPARRSARSILRTTLAAAALGAALAACGQAPTAPRAVTGGVRGDENGGIMGSGYNTPPDTTIHHP